MVLLWIWRAVWRRPARFFFEDCILKPSPFILCIFWFLLFHTSKQTTHNQVEMQCADRTLLSNSVESTCCISTFYWLDSFIYVKGRKWVLQLQLWETFFGPTCQASSATGAMDCTSYKGLFDLWCFFMSYYYYVCYLLCFCLTHLIIKYLYLIGFFFFKERRQWV